MKVLRPIIVITKQDNLVNLTLKVTGVISMSIEKTVITAPKGFDIKEVKSGGFYHASNMPNLHTTYSIAVRLAAQKLGVTLNDNGNRVLLVSKEKHIASRGAVYLAVYADSSKHFTLTLPTSKQTVIVDKTTLDFLISFMVWQDNLNTIKDNPDYSYSHSLQMKSECVFDWLYKLKYELLEGEIHMTDDEKAYATVMKPIVKELLG